MSKKKIRKKILNLRRLKFKKNITIRTSSLINILKQKNIYKKSIGGYFPVNFEIDDLNLLRELRKRKFKISLPVIKKNNQMDFFDWSFKDPLKVNKFGIPEPEQKKLVYPDIILVPIVAFDSLLFRLGYGGGYYDRYIKKLSSKKSFLTIGLAFSFQKIIKVPTNKYDKKLNIILTDKFILK